ncbi:MAG: translocase FtsK protein [Parcubacteria group bacterium GW2011_GWC2_39_14]|nr:MAG: translocase FtsK protein [Parcubacteria group bacterium GW2011_GWC2_39_14]KKR53692.1 MAG: translocase FtsK protein [Parcubacteria group bacterium GW2011_GWA2_40_23]
MGRKKRHRYEEVEYYRLSPETKRGILIVSLFALAIICVLGFLNLASIAGVYVDFGLGVAFGWGRFLFPIILLGLGYVLARPQAYKINWPNYVGIGLLILSSHSLLQLAAPQVQTLRMTLSGLGGGALGFIIVHPLSLYLGFWASLIIFIAILFASILLMFNTSIESILEKTNIFKLFSPVFKRREISDDTIEEIEEVEEEKNEQEEREEKMDNDKDVQMEPVRNTSKELLAQNTKGTPVRSAPKKKIDLPLSLLDNKRTKPTSGDIKVGKEKIQRTLANFNINVEMGEVQVGPTVTQYTFAPAEGVKLSRITALNNDLALALAAHPVRIEAPIPGKSLVGIEVPNTKPAIVRMRETLESDAFIHRKSNLEIPLGKDVSGKVWTANIASMPHLLVAGATGSGKSVCLNSIIVSLLYQNNTDTLRLILVDPKRVEFPVYNGIPHLLVPVITDVTKTVNALRWAMGEMDRRFDELAKYKKRNIESYNYAAKEKMPYIVIIIDELADLMVAAAAEVEGCIVRLVQMARAVGIHLIVATQRPSVDVITGLIKANIPCRIAFSVASLMDSRTILDSSGAEKLVGKGDMLYMSQNTPKPRRMQGAFLSDEEIKNVVDYLKKETDEPEYIDEITEKPKTGGNSSFEYNAGGDDDELFDEAKQTILMAGKASTSYLQRRLRIGYARAARLMDLLEEAGVIGPGDGAKSREILVDKTSALLGSSSSMVEDDSAEELEDNTFGEESNMSDKEPEEDISDDDEEENQTSNQVNNTDEPEEEPFEIDSEASKESQKSINHSSDELEEAMTEDESRDESINDNLSKKNEINEGGKKPAGGANQSSKSINHSSDEIY